MGIYFVLRVRDAEQDTLRIPGPAWSDPDSSMLFVCNDDGRELLEALKLPPDPAGAAYRSTPSALGSPLRRRLGRRSPAMPSSIDATPGRIPVIQAGRPEGYIEDRFGDLARLKQRGRAIGATHVAWD